MNIEEPEVLPGCHSLAATCKACKRPITIKVDNDCPDHEAERWLPMATCNHCYDLWRARQDVGEKIQVICITLIKLREDQKKPMDKEHEKYLADVHDGLLAKLRAAYNEYIKAVADWHNTQIVEGLFGAPLREIIAKPNEFWPVLRRVRADIAHRQSAPPFRLTPKWHKY